MIGMDFNICCLTCPPMQVCVFTADEMFICERHRININSQRRPFCEYEDEKISVSVRVCVYSISNTTPARSHF